MGSLPIIQADMVVRKVRVRANRSSLLLQAMHTLARHWTGGQPKGGCSMLSGDSLLDQDYAPVQLRSERMIWSLAVQSLQDAQAVMHFTTAVHGCKVSRE